MQSTPSEQQKSSEASQPITLPQTSEATPEPQAQTSNTEKAENIEFTEVQIEAALKSAHEFLNKGNFDDCCNILGDALKSADQVYGESSYEAARLHFELGSALLQKVESSRDVFGDAIKVGEKPGQQNNEKKPEEENKTEQKKLVPANVSPKLPTNQHREPEIQTIIMSKDEGENIDKRDIVEIIEEQDLEQGGEAAEGIDKQEEEVDDLQVAWEQMEVARVFLEKLVQACDISDLNIGEEKLARNTKVSKTLSQVMLRLGDANCYRENFDAAIQDYEKCLQLRKITEDNFFSRDLAEIYYLMGNAHLYKNYDTCDDVALSNFNRSRVILENLLYKVMGSSSVKDPEDVHSHNTFMSREYLKPSIFETAAGKELKEILSELYNKIDDTKEQKKERAKVAEELRKAKLEAEKSQTLESTFSKPVIGTEQSNDPNAANKPAPKIMHLGTLGSAATKKRKRDEMEKQVAANQNGNLQEQSIFGKKLPEEASKTTGQEDENKNLSGKATKTHEQGHIEKMSKI